MIAPKGAIRQGSGARNEWANITDGGPNWWNTTHGNALTAATYSSAAQILSNTSSNS